MGSRKVADDAALARRLREVRVGTRKSLRQVAREAGWSVARIQSYEAGTSSPTVRALRVLAWVYGTTATLLMEPSARASEAVPPPPDVLPTVEGQELRWVPLPDGRSNVLVCVGVVRLPAYHLLSVDGRAVVGWLTQPARRLQMQTRLGESPAAVRRKDVLGEVLGFWRKP